MCIGIWSRMDRKAFYHGSYWKGKVNAASIEPAGLVKLTMDLTAVNLALTYKSKEILDIEEVQRKKLKNRK
jgi:sialic acid synthase